MTTCIPSSLAAESKCLKCLPDVQQDATTILLLCLWGGGTAPSSDKLLLESGDYLLLEDGGKIVLEDNTP